MNHTASQSSNSGCVGRDPILPKLFGVATSPRPKCCCQMRLTITRAVSGLLADAIHCASASRRPLGPPGIVFQAVGQLPIARAERGARARRAKRFRPANRRRLP